MAFDDTSDATPEIHLNYDGDDLQIPVLPQKYEVSGDSGNSTQTLLSKGEITLIGLPKEHTVSWECFFPHAYKAGYCSVAEGDLKPPYEYAETLSKWRDESKILNVTFVGTNIAGKYTIHSFKYSESDASKDVDYSIELTSYPTAERIVTTEYTTTKVGQTTKSVKKKDKKGKTVTKKVTKTESLTQISRRVFGSAEYAKKIYQKNKKVIESAYKKWRKAEIKSRKRWNKKHPNKPKSLKLPKTSENGKHLIVGTTLSLSGIVK